MPGLRVSALRIEVVYALAQAQDLVTLELAPRASVRDAVDASGILERHAELDRDRMLLGIFGKRVRPDRLLRDGDRVEILRPLAEDPKESRRRRARRR